MAAKTPSAVKNLGVIQGAGRLLKATFTDIDATDTWTSALKGVTGHWFQRTDTPSVAASNGVSVGEAAGVFTFTPGEDNAAGDLYVIVQS